MWFLGLVIGALFGAGIGDLIKWDSAWLLFAALGALAGILYKDKRGAAPTDAQTLARRISVLEREVRELKERQATSTPPAEALVKREEAASTSAPAPVPEPLPAAASAADEPSAPPEPIASPELGASTLEPATPREPSWLWQKLFGGNILAKIGVVLLFFGIGSGLKLAIDFGLFPAAVRLLLAGVAGIAMIGFGFSRMRMSEHRMFGLALQGGGFGVLYLVTYFALARHGYIDHATAFALFAALGIACLVVAVHFEGEPLAILGIAGAFLAPLLASTGAGSHLVLFSYYAVLDVMVLGVNWLRAWRVLTLTAFASTLVTGMTWASHHFMPQFFASTAAFLVLFSVLFSLATVMSALAQRKPYEHWADTAVLFGTPIAAAVAHAWLTHDAGYGDVVLAWSAVGAGLYYSALAAVLYMRKSVEPARLAHLAIAIAFYTLAVPLAFGVQVTSAFWAIEGLALAWFAVANRRGLPYAAGLLLQLIAGVYFLIEWHEAPPMPILNGSYVGSTIIVACAAATAWISKRGEAGWLRRDFVQLFSALAGAWALAWWLGANFSEISHFAAQRHKIALYVAVLVGTAWALAAIGKALPWIGARYVALLLAALAALAGLFGGWRPEFGSHPLHDTMIFALPAAFATLYALLRANERDGLRVLLAEAHVYALILLAITLLREALWVAGRLAPHVTLWPLVAWQLVPVALIYALIHLDRHKLWPLTTQRGSYFAAGLPLLFAVAVVAALYANFNHTGGGSGLPYVPVMSFFDLAQIAVMAAVLAAVKAARTMIGASAVSLARDIAAGLGFVWVSALAMRLAHHWGGVPFNMNALLASGVAQSMLSLLWTALALTLMISATRKMLRQRWFLGFALLGVVGAKFVLIDVTSKGTVTWTLSLIGVGLLILAASYFSPAPPRAANDSAAPAS